MLENIRQISVFDKIFNISGGEWSRVFVSWAIRFFYRTGFVVAWTIIVAMFTGRYGIFSLPYLFILNAAFSMAGAALYSMILDRFRKIYLICGTIALSVFSLAIALYFSSNELIFFSFLLFTEAVFMVQLKVLIDGYVEELFSPLESERAFPLIESSETIGGIIAGITIVGLSASIATSAFIYFWVAVLLLIVPVLLIYSSFFHRESFVEQQYRRSCEENEAEGTSFLSKFKKEFSNSKNFSFFKGLIIIVFFHWFLYNLLEFQYTRAVYQNVSHVILDAGSGFEHAFVHDLGRLYIIFSSSALLIQFFVGSRLINSLGVMGSMLIHPIVTLLSLLGLSLNHSFSMAVLAKNNFTITSIIYMNVYHSSYYAIREKFREHAREFMEGVVRPLGAILGTFSIILLQKFVTSENLIFAINLAMLLVALVLFFVTFRQQKKYTAVAVDELLNSRDKQERLNAIDILAQRGHSGSLSALKEVLLDDDESISVRVAILKAFSVLQNVEALESILKCLNSSEIAVREAALNALLSYEFLGRSLEKYLFLEYEAVESLKKIYREEKKETFRLKIINLLSKLSPVAAYGFLIDLISNSKGNLKASAICALGNYHDENIAEVLLPYLKSKNPNFRLSAAIALGNIPRFKDESLFIIYSFLHSDNPNMVADALFAIGELDWKLQKNICIKYLDSPIMLLQMYSALALAKMGFSEAVPVLVDLHFSLKGENLLKLQNMLKNVDVRIYKNIDRILKHMVNEELEKLVKKNKMKDLSKGKLLSLQRLYSLIDEYDEMQNVSRILKLNFK